MIRADSRLEVYKNIGAGGKTQVTDCPLCIGREL